MSILSNAIERCLCEDFDVKVMLNRPERNYEYINIQELGINEVDSIQQRIFNITYRIMLLFEGMSVDVLEDDVPLQSSIGRILNRPGYVHIDNESSDTCIIIKYCLEDGAEVLTITLINKGWVC